MTPRSWCYSVGVLGLLLALAMAVSQNPWGATLPLLIGAFCIYIGFTEPVEYRPYVPSEWEEKLAEAARTRTKTR